MKKSYLCLGLIFIFVLGMISPALAEEVQKSADESVKIGQPEAKQEAQPQQKTNAQVTQNPSEASTPDQAKQKATELQNTLKDTSQAETSSLKTLSEFKATQEEKQKAEQPKKKSEELDNILKETYKRENSSATKIVAIDVKGCDQVSRDHILSVCASKVGDEVNEEQLRKDAEAIFELGFFGMTDYEVEDLDNGLKVTFVVTENPRVSEINFEGNTVYTADQLRAILFTQPGMIFNRTFFRNDIQRVKEKYQNGGYSMVTVKDVRIEGESITIVIAEPVISQIIVQGNKYTKRYVIDRYLKIKKGEVFNTDKLRQSVTRLQGLGYFSDVNVSFDSGETPEDLVVVITVEEARTGKLGFNVSYGTQSGFGGGITYENSNIGGNGMKLVVGFELGERRNYWLSYEQPYMSGRIMSWRFGAYRRDWRNIYFYYNGKRVMEYDRDKYGVYFGFGKLFKDESRYSWYVMLDWHNTRNDNISVDTYWTDYARDKASLISAAGYNPANKDDVVKFIKERELRDGNYYSTTFSARRNGLSPYVSYPKGDVENVNIQLGHANITDNTSNYAKYWFDGRFYFPLNNFFSGVIDSELFEGVDGIPMSLAVRTILGTSSGSVPYDEMYEIGGDSSLRGYDNDYLHGEQMFLGNIELRLPVAKMVTFVLFYDIGGAWGGDSGCLEGSYFNDMQSAPGVGIRLNTPMGNIRLDYATGDEGRFHFGFGDMF